MLAAPTLAIDLPLKALVWEDAEGKVWITHNSAEYLQRRHGFPREFLQNLNEPPQFRLSVPRTRGRR